MFCAHTDGTANRLTRYDSSIIINRLDFFVIVRHSKLLLNRKSNIELEKYTSGKINFRTIKNKK